MTDGQSEIGVSQEDDRLLQLPRVAILGPGQCGKDTASKWLMLNTPLIYVFSTSQYFEHRVANQLEDRPTTEESLVDWRRSMGQKIAEYNNSDGSGIRLYQNMAATHHIFNGIRRLDELRKCKEAGLIAHAIWLFRTGIPPDPSLEFGPHEALKLFPDWNQFYAIDNDRSKAELYRTLAEWCKRRGVNVWEK